MRERLRWVTSLNRQTPVGRGFLCARSCLGAFVWMLGLLAPSVATADTPQFSLEQVEFFEKQVRPLFVEHCQKCHGAEKQKGELRLDSREAVLKGGETGPAMVPGNPAESELIKALRYDPDGYQMPPDGKLPPETVAVFVKWIEMGAPWPASGPGTGEEAAASWAETFATRAERWSFQPLKRVSPPVVKNREWSRTPIDRFLLAKLEEAGLAPAPETDRRTWIRRAYFDTNGLPPAPEAVAAFVADESPDAFERVVDELLASPRFGERWGRHWLDLARYAESRGHEFDADIPNPWHYRDYVIRALNDDLPYDRFVTEHLAGDLLGGLGPRAEGLGPEGEQDHSHDHDHDHDHFSSCNTDLVQIDSLSTPSSTLALGPRPSPLGPSPPSAGPIQLVGRTTCDRIVVFEGNPRLAGTFAKIEVTDCTQTTLLGEIVTQAVQHGAFLGLPILV